MKILSLCLLLSVVLFSGQMVKGDALIRPKVIIVATFEVGADTGDKPGEFQFWVER